MPQARGVRTDDAGRMTTTTPRRAVEALRQHPRLAEGDDERFTGYGVMGVPFASGHYLALRDMLATSIGPAYRTVWHRDPHGRWTIHTDSAPELSCPRYFSSAVAVDPVRRIDVSWSGDRTLEVTIGDDLAWRIELAATAATRVMTAMGGALPEAGWDSRAVLATMGPMARTMLHTGRIRLEGTSPNGPRFKAAPLQVWRLADSTAAYRGEDLGKPGPLDEQAHLGDFWLPQRGVFFVGRARFTPVVERTGSRATPPSPTRARMGR
jgi:hypothetical protein